MPSCDCGSFSCLICLTRSIIAKQSDGQEAGDKQLQQQAKTPRPTAATSRSTKPSSRSASTAASSSPRSLTSSSSSSPLISSFFSSPFRDETVEQSESQDQQLHRREEAPVSCCGVCPFRLRTSPPDPLRQREYRRQTRQEFGKAVRGQVFDRCFGHLRMPRVVLSVVLQEEEERFRAAVLAQAAPTNIWQVGVRPEQRHGGATRPATRGRGAVLSPVERRARRARMERNFVTEIRLSAAHEAVAIGLRHGGLQLHRLATLRQLAAERQPSHVGHVSTNDDAGDDVAGGGSESSNGGGGDDDDDDDDNEFVRQVRTVVPKYSPKRCRGVALPVPTAKASPFDKAITRVQWNDGDRRLAATTSCSSRLAIIDGESLAVLRELKPFYSAEHSGQITDIACTDRFADRVYTSNRDGCIRLWDCRHSPSSTSSSSSSSCATFTNPDQKGVEITAVRTSNDDQLLISASDAGFCLWDARSTAKPVFSVDIRSSLAVSLVDKPRQAFSAKNFDVVNLFIEPNTVHPSVVFQLRNAAIGKIDLVTSHITNLIADSGCWRTSAEATMASRIADTLGTYEDVTQFLRWPLAAVSSPITPAGTLVAASSHSPFLKLIDFADNHACATSLRPLGANTSTLFSQSLITALDAHHFPNTCLVGLANQTLMLLDF